MAEGSNQRQVLDQYSKGRPVTLDFNDVERGIAQIEFYNRDFPLAAIVGVDDETTLIAAKASKAPGLPAPTIGLDRPATGMMMIPIPAAGVLRHVAGIEAARAPANIDDVIISIPIGGTLVPEPEGNRYLGFVFPSGDTPEAVEAALRVVHNELELTIEPG